VKGKQSPKRRGAKPAKAKVEAKRPVARKSGNGEGSRVGDLEKRLAEALQRETQASKREAETQEQQAATVEILGVISNSPADAQPVFDAIAVNALRLCDAYDVMILRMDGDVLSRVAHHGPIPPPPERVFVATRDTVSGRTVLDGRPIHVADLQAETEEFPVGSRAARQLGFRTVLSVPLLRDGVAIGMIHLRRTEVQPFSDKQIKLLQTFADQAVIAIENVRLFNEAKEALEQQTATADILRVISSSPTDLQPVLDAVVKSAARFCGAPDASVFQLDGRNLRADAHHGPVSQPTGFLVPVVPGSVAGRSVLERQAVGVTDLQVETEEFPEGSALARQTGQRATLSVPLLREGVPIGAILLRRVEADPFTAKQIDLLGTFADQAVIAIENVRLFKELEAANRELSAASQHKSEFLANMSHELRTPLNAIIGFSEVLSERMFGELNEKQEEYLKDIHASGQHLLSLINDILDLSKIEAGRMELELADFDLPTAIDNALTLVRERAGRRGIALHLSVDERLGPMRADERKIRQVVLNVLSNAIKFTPEGGRIEVAAVPRDEFVEVSVSDTGIGIAPEDQEAVFEEFRQVGTAAKKVEGTGLGLALSRKFIELHGGRIWVQSQLGVGSTFTFTIPVCREP
jgi:signal transduction histidine kinase/putative methionine-R-sulfoxide reductase with GAF domain